jgi:hypothetical protein
MGPRQRESFHTAEKQRVCPGCGARDTIVFWRPGPRQYDLMGNVTRPLVRLNMSRCSRCFRSFPRGTKFEETR